MEDKKIILGIDPGSTRIGIGIISKEKGIFKKKAAFLLTNEIQYKNNEGMRLVYIEQSLKKVIKKYRPTLAGIETLFFSKNKKTAFSVAQARGVIIKTLSEHHIPIMEFSPNQIKLAITGNGNATKNDVSKMVCRSLNIQTSAFIDDVTDALAIAIIAALFNKKSY